MARPIRRAQRGITQNWQIGRSSQSCNNYMLQNEVCCDVIFIAGSSKERIGAHRYVLISRSPVFFRLLARAQTNEVPIAFSSGAVRCLLNFLYTDTLTLSIETVHEVLHLSKEYEISTLQSACVEYIKGMLAVETACLFIQHASVYEEQDLFQHCLSYILANGESVLRSAGFLSLRQDLVDRVIAEDTLKAEERTVYECVYEWARAEAGRRQVSANDDNIRGILNRTLYLIRFPRLTISYFACVVAKGSLLTDTEKVALFRYFARADATVAYFNFNRRLIPIQQYNTGNNVNSCIRLLRSVGPLDCPFDDVIDANRHVAISFSSNRDIQLKGFLIFKGTKLQYQVHVKIYSGEANLLYEESINVTNYTTNTDDMTRVELATPIGITAQSPYTLSVRSSSPNLYYGLNGQISVTSGEVTFHFYECPLPNCSSSLTEGDLPGLLYSALA